jgi:hydroxyacylglutathione hydrolase
VDPRRPLRKQCTDPAIQVYQSDRHTFILRVSKAVSFEAPFIFLLFGNERAVLFDTGPSADPAKIPLRRTVDELVDAWLADHPRDDYELVVAHTHGHHDHRDGDPQFADRPRATVVGHTAEEVRGFFGFSEWPGQIVSFDLGGRVLELTGTPGHHPASVTVYDPWTGFVLTGDTIMQGRLYAKEYPDFLQSLERLLEFAAQRNITRVPACHIEISRTPGHDYPAGNTYQPDEVSLRLSAERITEIRHAARAATKPGVCNVPHRRRADARQPGPGHGGSSSGLPSPGDGLDPALAPVRAAGRGGVRLVSHPRSGPGPSLAAAGDADLVQQRDELPAVAVLARVRIRVTGRHRRSAAR